MSDANLNVGINGRGAQTGANTVIRALNDIINAANNANTSIKSVESSLSRLGTSNSGLSQAKAAMQQMQSPLQSIKSELEKIESRIVRIGATALALGVVHVAFGKIREVILGAVKAVDDFQIATISIAASLTQIGITNGSTDIAGTYEKSSRYAGILALKLQEVDKNSFANYKGLMAMLQVMTAQGQVLDVNNKKQVEAFTNLSNAIAIMTPGQDQQMQMYQETRALMSGIADRHSQVARMIDQQIKAQGIYKGGLKEVAALGRQHGDTMERLAPYLQGVGAASKDISKTWSTVIATFETALNFVQRMTFGPIVADLTTIVALFSKLMTNNTGTISDAMQKSWSFIKDAVFDIGEKTKELKFSPEFLNTLKTTSQVALAIIDSFAILIKWTIKYSEEIKNITVFYVAWKVQATVMNALMMVTTTSLNTNTTAQVANTQSVMMAFEKESLRLASQKATATFLAEQAGIVRLLTVEEVNRAAALTEGLLAEQASNVEKIKTLSLLKQQAAVNAEQAAAHRIAIQQMVNDNIRLAESEVLAAANRVKTVEQHLALIATEMNTLKSKGALTAKEIAFENELRFQQMNNLSKLIVLNGELAISERHLSNVKIASTRTSNAAITSEIAARAALTTATNAHTAAVTVAAKTGFQIHIAKEAEIVARVANKVAIDAETLALERQTAATTAATIGARALSGAKGLVAGAVTALGGPLGAIITLLTLGATAWWIWGKNAREATGANYSDSIEAMTEKIKKQNKELAERDRITKEGGSTDSELEAIKKEEEKLASLTKRINELGGPVTIKAGQSFSTLNVKLNDTSTALMTMQMQADKAKSNILALKAAIDERDRNTPKAPKGGTGVPFDDKAEPLSEADKQFNKLREGFKAFQQDAVKHGKVEDELGAKITSRNLAMRNLFAETKLASGDEAARMKKDIEGFVALANAEDTLAANKKATRAVEKAYQEQSLSNLKNNIAAKKVELTDSLEEGKISHTEYYQSIRTMVEELGNKEIEMFQSSYDAKKAEADQRAEMYWEGTITYSEYLKSVKELIEEETKLKNLKAGVAATVASANKDITKGQKDEAKLVADIEDKVLTLTKQWVAAAKAKNAYYKTTDAYKKLPAAAKKRADAMSELDEFSSREQQKKDGSDLYKRGISAIGGEGIGSKMSPIVSQYEEETQFLKKQYELRLMDKETYNMQMSAAETNHQAQMTDLVLSSALEATGLLRQAAGDSIEMQMASMLIEKGIAIARIMINTELTQSALLASAAMAGVGLPGPAAAAAVAAATTAAMTQAQMVRTMNYISIGIIAASAVIEGINIAGKREAGGPVSAGKAYIVGEKRPEIFVPDRNGTILPNVPTNGQADNGSVVINQTVQIDARGADAGVEARIDAAMKRAKAETEASIMNSMNRGGKFAVASGRR